MQGNIDEKVKKYICSIVPRPQSKSSKSAEGI